MSLKASIVGLQVKQLKGALQYLAKIGAELLIEALPEKLILRSINSSRSAYASITYTNDFFDGYNIFGATVVQAGVLAKQALSLFRTQRIVKIYLELDSTASKLTAEVSAENGLEKQYKIPCMDTEILQTSVDKDTFPTCVNAAANELNRLLSTFQKELEEITIIAMPEETEGEGHGRQTKAVQLHSFIDPAKGHADRTLHTQLSVDTHELFLDYRHNSSEASDVTFNLKDFKAMLVLCEGLGANVTICFEQPGAPLLVQPLFHSNNPLEEYVTAELVLATLLETARLGDSGPATVAAKARRRVDTPGGGQIPGDTPWRPDGQGSAHGHGALQSVSRSGAVAATAHRPSRFRTNAEPPRFSDSPAQSNPATAHRSTREQDGTAHATTHDGPSGARPAQGDSLLRFRRTPLGRRIEEASGRSSLFGAGLGSEPANGDDGMGSSSRHEGGTMDMGGTGLRDDGSTGAHAAHEDGDMNSAPPDAYGHRSIPSGLIDDGSHNPSLSGERYQGLQTPSQQGQEAGPGRSSQWSGATANADRGLHNAAGSLQAPEAEQGQPFDNYQESEWQNAGPVQRRYLAAELFDDDDEDMDDEEAIPGTP
ncbi:g11062 [Coccomyxa elongata]